MQRIIFCRNWFLNESNKYLMTINLRTKLYAVFLFLTPWASYSQFKYYDTGERAIYDEQIWKLDSSVLVQANYENNYLRIKEWISQNIESKKIVVSYDVEGETVRFKTFHNLFYLKSKERLGSYPFYCEFQIRIKGKNEAIFDIISIIYKERDNIRDEVIRDVSLFEIRPYRTVGKRTKKMNDYPSMISVEKYLLELHGSLSEFVLI